MTEEPASLPQVCAWGCMRVCVGECRFGLLCRLQAFKRLFTQIFCSDFLIFFVGLSTVLPDLLPCSLSLSLFFLLLLRLKKKLSPKHIFSTLFCLFKKTF